MIYTMNLQGNNLKWPKKHFQNVDLKTWDTTFGGHANHDGCDDDDGDDTLLMGLMKKADILATEG